MATLFVSEFYNWANAPGGGAIMAPQTPAITAQTLVISSTETKTALLNVATKIVQIQLDSGACRILFGASGSPAVTASPGMRLANTTLHYFGVQGSDTLISAISTA